MTAELSTVRGAHSLAGLAKQVSVLAASQASPGQERSGQNRGENRPSVVQPGLETAVAVGML